MEENKGTPLCWICEKRLIGYDYQTTDLIGPDMHVDEKKLKKENHLTSVCAKCKKRLNEKYDNSNLDN